MGRGFIDDFALRALNSCSSGEKRNGRSDNKSVQTVKGWNIVKVDIWLE